MARTEVNRFVPGFSKDGSIPLLVVLVGALQFAVAALLLKSGFPLWSIGLVMSTALILALIPLLGVTRRNALLGATIGAAIGFAHLAMLTALSGSADRMPWDAAIGLVAVTLAGIFIGGAGVIQRYAAGLGIVVSICISVFVITHFSDLAAIGRQPFDGPATLVAGSLLLAGLGMLIGGRLGEMLPAGPAAFSMSGPFRHVAEALPIPLLLTSADHTEILFANHRSREQFGLAAADGEDLSTEALYADSEDIRSLARMIRSQGAVEGVEVRMTRADGSTCWTLIAARSISFDGKPAILAGYYDITDRKAAEEALMASEVRYALISRASNDGIWDWDLATGEVFYSSRWKEIIGSATNRRLNRLEDWLSLVHVEDVAELRLRIEEHVSGATPQLDAEYRIRSGEGEYRWMQCRGIVIRDSGGRPIRMAGSQSDITLRKTYEIRLRNAAYRDQLTGMHNRTFFAQELEQLDSPERLGRRALMVCNVDQFRRVNDRFGSAAGDRLLIMVGERLTLLSGPLDLVARIGDDEFVILLGDVSTRADAMALAETILHDLAQPCQLDSALLPVSVSAGLALPSLGAVGGGADLLRNARLALDRSKQNGGGRYTLFDEQLVSEIELRERLSRDLMSAVQGNQIFFDYQPVVALGADGVDRIAGFEALMRWTHPEFGLLHPAQFVPLAEDAGIIGQLGLYAIESAARQIERWSRNGRVPPEFSVAVNLSALQISDPASVKRIYALLDRLALPVGRLKLELTESVMMSDPETMAVVFAGLRDRGVRLSLDDFGTGFSSLSYLHRFPLDTLKIDQSFVTRIGKAPEALRLVRSIIELGHDLGLTIVAEGVEEAGEAEQLRALGCDFAQGYYFSRAVGLEQAEILLARGLLI